MRRQGPQHGIVRSYRILPPPLNPRPVNSPQTSEILTKLPPNAHRKVWLGQVHWGRSNDIASSSYKLLTWRVRTSLGSTPVFDLPDILDPHNCDNNVEKEEECGVQMVKTEKNGDSGEKEVGDQSYDYDESMSFYDVGMMMEHVLDDDEEDGWCFV